ncbi:MAG: hypothetical protein DRP92_00610 [Candidatus Neomarinimicrobiota bacterium]|nr:MAG: hypothetical protein DRP92_00610 [Candidatus Neomarinimicrobiota bacterium]
MGGLRILIQENLPGEKRWGDKLLTQVSSAASPEDSFLNLASVRSERSHPGGFHKEYAIYGSFTHKTYYIIYHFSSFLSPALPVCKGMSL